MITAKKEAALIAAAVVLCLAVGFGAGRFAAPTKTITTEKIVQVSTDKVVTTVDTDKILEALKTLNVQKDVHTVRVIEREKDGTTKTTVTQDDKSKSEAAAQTEAKSQTVQTKVETKTVYVDREITKTVERATRPQWALDLTPGFDFAGALGHGNAYSIIPSGVLFPHLVLGAAATRRLIGPLSAGVWLNSAGMGGAVLRLEF